MRFRRSISPPLFSLLIVSVLSSSSPARTPELNDVCFVSATTGIAVGDSGTVLRTTDAGITWVSVAVGTDYDIRAVDFYDSLNGMMVGEICTLPHSCPGEGAAYMTTDGGVTWLPMPALNINNYRLYGVAMSGPGSAVAVGWEEFGTDGVGRVLRTTDNGYSWDVNAYSPYLKEGLDVSFSDAANGVAVFWGGVTVATTSDSGVTWSEQSVANFQAVHVNSSGVGYAVGSRGVIYYTEDTGKSWTQQTSGSTAQLLSVHFLDPQVVVVVGWGGTILQTSDGGALWQLLTPVTGDLHGTVIFDAQIRVAVGTTFYWPNNPNPTRDGVVLRSDTGGSTWSVTTAVPIRQRNWGSIKSIFR